METPSVCQGFREADSGEMVKPASGYLPKVENGWLVHAVVGSGLEENAAKAANDVEQTLESAFLEFD